MMQSFYFSESNSRNPATSTPQPPIERKVSAAFADVKPVNPDDFVVSDIPLTDLFISRIEDRSSPIEKPKMVSLYPFNRLYLVPYVIFSLSLFDVFMKKCYLTPRFLY